MGDMIDNDRRNTSCAMFKKKCKPGSRASLKSEGVTEGDTREQAQFVYSDEMMVV